MSRLASHTLKQTRGAMRSSVTHCPTLCGAAAAIILGSLGLASPCTGADLTSFIQDWIARSEQAKADQPHWMTPLVTVTPRLEQEFRLDESWQAAPHGLGGNLTGPRLELIPTEPFELILTPPSYVTPSRPRGLDGWGDTSFLVKYRLAAANEESGNYILTLFMAASAPTGSRLNGAGHAVFTPTIALGKGYGDFDLQSTVGVSFPNGGMDRLGMPLVYNTAFQYRVLKAIWPELEVNYTWFPDGVRAGQSQVYLTPGVILGRLPIWKTLGFVIGAGCQVAVTRHRSYDRNWILSIRTPF
jgi:hypothetical protein